MRKPTMRCITFAAAVVLSFLVPARAQSVADFYRGKTLRMLVGYGPGGGYDLYGRLVAEFLPRHLPGNPSILAQNMPGAGSFVAAKYMSDVAPKDGTVFGSLSQTLALDSLSGNAAKVDVEKFAYVGRVVTNVDVGVTLPKTGIKSFDDVRKKQYSVGASGGGSTTVMYPAALNRFAGSNFKIVKGYSGTTDIQLALERGEVDILPASNAPTLPELAVDDEGRAVLHAIASTAEIGRSIITTPGVPADRLTALRTAFQAMLSDPEFITTAEKRNLMIDGAHGEEMDDIVRDTLKAPPNVLAKIGQVSN